LPNVPGWIDLDLNLQAQPLGNPSGDPQLNAAIGAAYPLQNAAHPTGLWLTEATIERRAGTGELALKAGVFSLNPGFVSTPVLDQYVHSALRNTLNFNIDGPPINPYVAPGLLLARFPSCLGRPVRGQPRPEHKRGQPAHPAVDLHPAARSQRPGGTDLAPGSDHLPQASSPQVQLGGGYLASGSSGESNGSHYGTVTLACPCSWPPTCNCSCSFESFHQQPIGRLQPVKGLGIATQIGVVGLGQAPIGPLDHLRARPGL
jgi:hypothetical protein